MLLFLIISLLVLAILATALAIAKILSPWPAALFYRGVFNIGGTIDKIRLAKYVPADVTSRLNIAYGDLPIEKLDVHLPPEIEGSSRRVPTIVWIHGGGFLSGGKSLIGNYAKIIAGSGYGVVAIDYALAPDAKYPTPARQANAALAFLKANGHTLNLDTDRIVIAGDSAGAHIAAQLGIALSNPDYARATGVEPAVPLASVRGLLLYCGFFDPALFEPRGFVADYLDAIARSYLDMQRFDPAMVPETFPIPANLTSDMPPLFITVGNNDLLTAHSEALAAAARQHGVAVETLFFPAEYKPALGHEYQFDLSTAAGQEALARTRAFLARHVQ
ncbi:alpha/beta hydrolase [Leptospira interrogans]